MTTATASPVKAEAQHLSHPKYRPDIDGLRAVAVLAVIGFHAFPSLVPGGFVGVDIFFVISGFLISSIIFRNLADDHFSYAEFYARRIRRIFPALILVLLACLICGWFEVPTEYKQLGKHVAAGAGFVSNLALWKDSGYFDAAADQKPLLHLWSLGIEEQFYIIWPLLLGLVWKRKYEYFLSITLVILCGSFFINVYTVQSHPIAAFYSPLSRFWELMIGGVLAYVTLHRPHLLPKNTNWLPVAGLVMILLSVVVLNKFSAFPGWWALLPTVGAFLVISAGHTSWTNRNLLGNPALVWIGLISYPLYLWHWPVLFLFRQVFVQEYLSHMQLVLGRICAVGVSIVLSWLTYKLVEIPIRIGGLSRSGTFALAGMLALVAVFGILTYQTDGFAYRLPAQLAEILRFNYSSINSVGYRIDSCLLEADQDQTQFRNCTTSPPFQAVSRVLLWGDSHAAQLYPGIRSTIGSDSEITQFSASLCPPILGYSSDGQPHCKAINTYVMDWVAREKPDCVILAALWTEYDWRQLGNTLTQLQAVGVKKIDLVGPVPVWHRNLPVELFLHARIAKFRLPLPERMTYGLDESIQGADASMRQFAMQAGIHYFSPYSILCNSTGCLTRVGDAPDQITAWDRAHLTIAASQYVVSHFTEQP